MKVAQGNIDTSQKSELRLIFREFSGSFVFVSIFSFFINVLMLTQPFYMLQVYDRVIATRSEETLLFLTLIVLWLFFSMGLLEFVRSRLFARIGNKLDECLNVRLYSAMGQLSLYQPEAASVQPLSDLASIRQFITGPGILTLFDAPWAPIYLVGLFMFHSWLGWFAVGVAVIVIFLALGNEWSTRRLLKSANESSIQSKQIAGAQLRNSEVVHAMGMEDSIREHWLKEHSLFLQRQSEAADRAGVWLAVSKTITLVAQSLVLGMAGYLVIGNEITAGMIIAGSILFGRVIAPVNQMIAGWKQYKTASIAYKRLDALLKQFPKEEQRISLPSLQGFVEFQSVTVVPPGSNNAALQTVNFSLQAGETLTIIGPSAAGKSTLVRAMLGVWPVTSGVVRLDQSDVRHWNTNELGPHIGYLPQDVELFAGTIADNISRFQKVDDKEVIKAAKKAGVDEMIKHLPDGYHTLIGSGGAALSGGQRQRIGLARALFGMPGLVVLDEPNANLDEIGERALLNACLLLKKEKVTLVVITHRRDILKITDKLLLLVDGRVECYGERDAVLKQIAHNQQRSQKQQHPGNTQGEH